MSLLMRIHVITTDKFFFFHEEATTEILTLSLHDALPISDVVERALYNGINSGMSLDGTLYCYRNPLGFDPSGGDQIRHPWYDTTCCPPNLERTFASLPGYFYSTSKAGLYLHLYDNAQLDWHL